MNKARLEEGIIEGFGKIEDEDTRKDETEQEDTAD